MEKASLWDAFVVLFTFLIVGSERGTTIRLTHSTPPLVRVDNENLGGKQQSRTARVSPPTRFQRAAGDLPALLPL